MGGTPMLRKMREHDLPYRARDGREKANRESARPPRLEHQRDAKRHAEQRQSVQRTDDHCLMVPNVTPRSRCFRTSTVNTAIGSTNSSAPAATCGQGTPSMFPCKPAK